MEKKQKRYRRIDSGVRVRDVIVQKFRVVYGHESKRKEKGYETSRGKTSTDKNVHIGVKR